MIFSAVGKVVKGPTQTMVGLLNSGLMYKSGRVCTSVIFAVVCIKVTACSVSLHEAGDNVMQHLAPSGDYS